LFGFAAEAKKSEKNARPAHALRQMRSRSERIIGFELDHRPDDHAHRRERLLERMELREPRKRLRLTRLSR
jgi:hypothetical protein